MISHIVFDFGGVILDLDGVHTGYPDDLAEMFSLPLERTNQIWNANKTSVMTGKETPKEFLARMKEELNLSFDIEEGFALWERKNGITKERIDWKLVRLLEHLKTNYSVHMLSDQIQLTNGASEWIDEIHDQFHTLFRSYEQGFRKPDSEAFTNMLKKIGATDKPDSVVFIDDSARNIEAAKNLGIHSVLYTYKNHDLLYDQFEKLGIKL